MGGPAGPNGLLPLSGPSPLPIWAGPTDPYGLQAMSKPTHLYRRAGLADGPARPCAGLPYKY